MDKRAEEMIELLETRRSCRRYRPEVIAEEELSKIIEAGLYAPSGMNLQSTKILVIQEKEVRDKLARIAGIYDGNMDGDAFYGAPVVTLVVSDTTNHTWMEDGSLVLGNMMNAASALRVGSCWIHWARETLETPYGKKLCKKWGLPETYAGIGFCILGYPQQENTVKTARKEGRVMYV